MDHAAVGRIQPDDQKHCRACGSELKTQQPFQAIEHAEPFMFCTKHKCPLQGRVIKSTEKKFV